MTLQSFRARVIAHAFVLEMEGLPHDLLTVIEWDAEWCRKYRDALMVRYDS